MSPYERERNSSLLNCLKKECTQMYLLGIFALWQKITWDVLCLAVRFQTRRCEHFGICLCEQHVETISRGLCVGGNIWFQPCSAWVFFSWFCKNIGKSIGIAKSNYCVLEILTSRKLCSLTLALLPEFSENWGRIKIQVLSSKIV